MLRTKGGFFFKKLNKSGHLIIGEDAAGSAPEITIRMGPETVKALLRFIETNYYIERSIHKFRSK